MPKHRNRKRNDPPQRRPILRRFLKAVAWCLGVFVALLVVLAVAGWIIFHNPTTLANLILGKFTGNYSVVLKKLDVSERGKVRLDGVTVTELLPRKDNPLVAIDGVDLGYDLGELRREGKVRKLRLDGPVLRLDESTFSMGADVGGDPAQEPEELARKIQFLGRIAEGLEVREGRVEIDLPGAPKIAFDWDLTSEALDFSGKEWLSGKPVAIELDNLRIGEGEGMAQLGKVVAEVRVRSDLSGIEVEDLEFAEPSIRIMPDMWAPVSREAGAAAPEPKQVGAPAAPGFDVVLKSLRIRNGRFELRGFDGREGRPALPDLGFQSTIEWQNLRYEEGRVTSEAPLALRLDNIEVRAGRSAVAETLADARSLEMRFSPQDLLEGRRIESVILDAPAVRWTPENVERFFGEAAEEPEDRPAQPGEPEPGDAPNDEISWKVGTAEIREGAVDVRGLKFGGRTLPALAVSADCLFKDLAITGSGKVTSDSLQEIRLRGLRIDNPEPKGGGAAPPLAEMAGMRARFRIGELLEKNQVAELKMEKPVIHLTDDTIPGWLAEMVVGGRPPAAAGEPQAAEPQKTADGQVAAPAPWEVADLSLTGGVFQIDTGQFGGRLPKVEGNFNLETLPEPESGGRRYRATLDQVRIRARGQADEKAAVRESDVAFIRRLGVDFSARDLQEKKRIERVEIEGAVMNVGGGLDRLVKGDDGEKAATEEARPAEQPAAAGETPGPAAAAGEPWRIGVIQVSQSQVRFEALIPQIQGLEFDVSTTLRDVPLSRDGLLAQDAKQKVELGGIEIWDPYDSFIKVADLPTIFVEFSLAGLAGQRIDKVDLIGPILYVGQGLFWWVDYQRNFRKQNEGAGFAENLGGAQVPPPDEGGEDWQIKQINAHFGKLVIAPAGTPIGVVPFPFHSETDLDEGRIALNLEIPDEEGYIYEFPDLKLKLFGLSGKIDFNVPIEQKDNNMVQFFELKRAVWKQYEAEKLFMEVTYDENGIYGKFGGSAYAGYVEGQFNVYLNDLGKWDAWIAGSDMNMAPITQAVTPENFLMDGKVNAKLVSEGRKLDFGETWGDVKALSPGRIDVAKLAKIIEDLPKEWPMWRISSTKLGLETLKEFAYDTGKGDLYFVGQDGWLRLDLRGPAGSRVVNFYAHDWRKKNGVAAEPGENKNPGDAPPEEKLDTAKNEGID